MQSKLPMHLAKRCHAHSKRSGKPCQSPAVNGYEVCRMHGAKGGAPVKTGEHTKAAKERQARFRDLIAKTRALTKAI